MRTLVVIPARGGSKGIPRKNLRPFGGRPLLVWAVEAARKTPEVDRVLVSTDSEEIAHLARRQGAGVVMRDPRLAQDGVTLDPVIHEAVEQLEAQGERFELVLTVQATSPLLRSETISKVIARFEDEGVDSVLTVVDDTHLSWVEGPEGLRPDYEERLNRQELPRRYRETGGVLATRRALVTPSSRLGSRVEVQLLDTMEGIDIDGPDDWLMAEAALARKRIAFVLIGNPKQGLGHVTRVQTLMELLSGHNCQVFCRGGQELAVERLEQGFLPVRVVEDGGLLGALKSFGAEIVVHDELDTQASTLAAERDAGMKVVCFEDQGGGKELADLLVNALFPEEESAPGEGRLYGPDWYCLREEFRQTDRAPWRDRVERVLVTFGGTDPSHLTRAVLDALADLRGVEITVIAGLGLEPFFELQAQCKELTERGSDLRLLRDVPLMSHEMARVDLAFSSAGRTLYELAHMGVPTIVLAQNEIELQHHFACPENGFVPLGLGAEVSRETIAAAYRSLAGDGARRKELRERMRRRDLAGGRDRVVRRILEL